MRKLSVLLILALAALPLLAGEFKVGSTVGDFRLEDLKGNPVQYSAYKGDTTVILFIATQCPVSNAYNERMNALYSEFAPKGVKFVAINSNRTEPGAETADHAKKNGFQFAVLKDPGNVIADRFGATVTPEVFVVDKSGVIAYHGRIDDSQNPDKITKRDLSKALNEILSNKSVESAETKAFGCTIKRVSKAS
jgi:peroxiredoxin